MPTWEDIELFSSHSDLMDNSNKTVEIMKKKIEESDKKSEMITDLEKRRLKRIEFVNNHKEEIENLKKQPILDINLLDIPLNKMLVKDLKKECMIRDLKTSGKKSELIERLTNMDKKDKAKRPYHPRLMFACWLQNTAPKRFIDEEDEYDIIQKFYRGSWEFMEAYVEYKEYFKFVAECGEAFGAFDY